MQRTILILVGLVVITGLVIAGVMFWGSPNNLNKTHPDQNQQENSEKKGDLENGISVTSPQSGDEISSPITIKGKAKGAWYFEGQFPVTISDVEHNELGSGVAQAQGEWTTEDYVGFQAQVEFQTPTSTKEGMIILENSNPSGKPSKSRKAVIPVKFK